MTTLTIKINEHSKKGKAFLAFAKTFFDKGNDIEIVKTESKKVDKEESPYNPELLKMVLDSEKTKSVYSKTFNDKMKKAKSDIEKGETITINPEDLWGSLGLK